MCPTALQIVLIFYYGVSCLDVLSLPSLYVSLIAWPFHLCEMNCRKWKNAFEDAWGCAVRKEEDGTHRMSLELTEVILHMQLFPATLLVAQPTSLSPAILSSSNAVLSKTLFLVLFEKQSSLSRLNNLPPPHYAILSSKFQTVWFMMLFQVKHSCCCFFAGGWILSHWPCTWRCFKLSPMIATCGEIQREGTNRKWSCHNLQACLDSLLCH